MEDDNKTKNPDITGQIPPILFWIVFAAGAGATIALLVFYNHFTSSLSDSQEQWGQFGDYVGGVLNPFFSFLALIAILYSIVLQSRELKLSTEELRRSSEALKEQSKMLEIQNFENTFFQMTRLHNDIVDGIIDGNTRGRESFKLLYEHSFSYHYERHKDLKTNPNLKIVQMSYTYFLNEHQGEIGHYFRNLYTIIRYIHDSDMADKKKYIRIIRAQLSSYELVLLFYNSLNDVGRKRFKPLIEEYELLENMDLNMLKNPCGHIKLYELTAYGDQDLSKYLGDNSSLTTCVADSDKP